MTDTPMPTSRAAHELLSSTRDLTRRVRDAQRAAWLPLLLFSAVTFGAALVDHLGYAHRTLSCGSISDGAATGRICVVFFTGSFVYWPCALTLAYAIITVFYVRRTRSRGIGTRIRPYIYVGIVLAILLTGVSLWAAHHTPITETDFLGIHLQPGSSLMTFFYRLISPASAIGLALLVLARVERSWALLVFTFGYLLIVLVPIDFGWAIDHPSSWIFLPRLAIDGSVLLLGGIGFALTQRATP